MPQALSQRAQMCVHDAVILAADLEHAVDLVFRQPIDVPLYVCLRCLNAHHARAHVRTHHAHPRDMTS